MAGVVVVPILAAGDRRHRAAGETRGRQVIRSPHAASSNGRTAMFRFAALAAVAAAFTFTPVAAAAVTCNTDAAAEIAGAAVNGPRAGWDPPVWTFDMSDLNMSVDVQAYDRDSAAAKAQAWLQGQVDSVCAAANPAPAPSSPSAPSTAAPAPTAPTTDQTAAATSLVDAATVTYVGNSWGPIPLWRVDLPAMHLSIDVAANSADEARANVVALVAARLAADNPTPATGPVATAATTTPQSTVTAPAVTSAGVTTTPVETERLLTPTLDPGIRAMLLATTP